MILGKESAAAYVQVYAAVPPNPLSRRTTSGLPSQNELFCFLGDASSRAGDDRSVPFWFGKCTFTNQAKRPLHLQDTLFTVLDIS